MARAGGLVVDTEHRMVFIGGVHRSGTSLLHRLVRSHPLISGFENTGSSQDEGQHLQTVFPSDQELGGVGNFGFHAHAAMDETHSLANPTDAERLWREWLVHWDLSKPCLVEKSPANLIRTRYLQYCFPNSRFLILLRHPIATSYAMRQRGWNTRSMAWLIEHALVCYERFLRDRAYLSHYYVLHYEDLVERPAFHLNSVFSWIGLPEMEIHEGVRSDINGRYFEGAAQDGMMSAISSERLLEVRCNVFGYSLKSPHQRLAVPWSGAHDRHGVLATE